MDAAWAQFSEYGFDGTTMRGIAQAAKVDSALIHHFFVSKEGLFLAAVRIPCRTDLLAKVSAGDADQVGERLAQAFLGHWESPQISPQIEKPKSARESLRRRYLRALRLHRR